MFIRAIALSLALFLGIGSIIPVIFQETTEAKPRYKNKKSIKLRKYSKAWWRWYRKQQRKKRAILARKRALRAKQILLSRRKLPTAKKQIEAKSVPPKVAESQSKQILVSDNKIKTVGTVQLSVVGQANGADADKKIGGVSTSILRRDVVDRMVKEDGWVINDYQKSVHGKNVYVVVAQTAVKGSIQTRLFYFTEIDGKIYNLSTTSPKEGQDQAAIESEKVIESLQRGSNLVGLK